MCALAKPLVESRDVGLSGTFSNMVQDLLYIALTAGLV